PYCSQSSCDRSVVKPSSFRRLMSRCTGSLAAGDSRGSSAFSCIFVDETDQIGEFKRFAEEVVGAALAGFLRDVAIAGEADVRDLPGTGVRLQQVAQLSPAHPLDGQVGEDHGGTQLLGAR